MNNTLKVSIVTAVYNRIETISDAMASVKEQNYPNISHVIVDGKSTDGTINLIKKIASSSNIIISEPDSGIYDALNKGINIADGDIIGLLHSDDLFADKFVVSDIMKEFANPDVSLVYGDLLYVDKHDTSKVIRRWISGSFSKKKLLMGWMPPHPTVFIRSSLFKKFGIYDSSFKISADYDAMVRYFQCEIQSNYIPRVLVRMRVGGASNTSLRNILIKMKEDYSIIKKNNLGGFRTLIWKSLSKIFQFIPFSQND